MPYIIIRKSARELQRRAEAEAHPQYRNGRVAGMARDADEAFRMMKQTTGDNPDALPWITDDPELTRKADNDLKRRSGIPVEE